MDRKRGRLISCTPKEAAFLAHVTEHILAAMKRHGDGQWENETGLWRDDEPVYLNLTDQEISLLQQFKKILEQYCSSGLDDLEAACTCSCDACDSCGNIKPCHHTDYDGAPLCDECWRAWQSAMGAESEDD